MAKKLEIGDLDAIFEARFGNAEIEEKSEDASLRFSPLAPDKTRGTASLESPETRAASSEMPDQPPEATTPARRPLAASAATRCPAPAVVRGEPTKGVNGCKTQESHNKAYARGTQNRRTADADIPGTHAGRTSEADTASDSSDPHSSRTECTSDGGTQPGHTQEAYRRDVQTRRTSEADRSGVLDAHTMRTYIGQDDGGVQNGRTSEADDLSDRSGVQNVPTKEAYIPQDNAGVQAGHTSQADNIGTREVTDVFSSLHPRPLVRVSFRLPPDEVEYLDWIAVKFNTTRTDALRLAIAWLRRQAERSAG